MYFTLDNLNGIIGESTLITDFDVCVIYKENEKIRVMRAKNMPFNKLNLLNNANDLKIQITRDIKTFKNLIRLSIPETEDGDKFSDSIIGLQDLGSLAMQGIGMETLIPGLSYVKVRLKDINNRFEEFECLTTNFKIFSNMAVRKIEFDVPGIIVYVDSSYIKD